jgi:transposase
MASNPPTSATSAATRRRSVGDVTRRQVPAPITVISRSWARRMRPPGSQRTTSISPRVINGLWWCRGCGGVGRRRSLAVSRCSGGAAPAGRAAGRRGALEQVAAARALGVSDRTVGLWVRRFRREGAASLAKRRRGRRAGEQQALSGAQQQKIAGLIAGRCPDQLKIPGLLGTRSAVQALIEQQTGLRLEISTVGRDLCQWVHAQEAVQARARAGPRRRAGVAGGCLPRAREARQGPRAP